MLILAGTVAAHIESFCIVWHAGPVSDTFLPPIPPPCSPPALPGSTILQIWQHLQGGQARTDLPGDVAILIPANS